MRTPASARQAARTTICISSQAGCAVGCPFCATGQAGFGRQLSAGEIVDQVLHWHRAPWLALGPDWRPGAAAGHYNIVFMGMGEPLNNVPAVFEAVRLLNDSGRLGIGARHITVSTSGVVPGMGRMIDELPQVNLAISLHAADDELRDELVPI
ncbi:MAG: radical SAM protein, partial [Chloroflexi bacterium]